MRGVSLRAALGAGGVIDKKVSGRIGVSEAVLTQVGLVFIDQENGVSGERG